MFHTQEVLHRKCVQRHTAISLATSKTPEHPKEMKQVFGRLSRFDNKSFRFPRWEYAFVGWASKWRIFFFFLSSFLPPKIRHLSGRPEQHRKHKTCRHNRKWWKLIIKKSRAHPTNVLSKCVSIQEETNFQVTFLVKTLCFCVFVSETFHIYTTLWKRCSLHSGHQSELLVGLRIKPHKQRTLCYNWMSPKRYN